MSNDTPDLRPPSRTAPGTAGAAAAYLAIALIFTWPLAAGLASDIPWDLGDSLLNAWILAWNADHLTRFLGGDVGALRGLWNANIFHPEPLTLAYSEHLFAQALQIVPLYALTSNIILCYNLLFISTFALSGLGTYLLVRDLTGSSRAGFVAGLVYAFAPYRVPQFAHLQVLSSQWMPFALYGLRRYFATGRGTALAGGALAMAAQNLSNGYFMLFFAPFSVAYVAFELTTRRLWRDARVLASLAAAAAGVAAVTLPFLLPYLELRAMGFGPRVLNEVKAFSADVLSYWTAPPESPVWGRVMRAFPKSEGDLFQPLAALVLAGAGIAAGIAGAWKATAGRVPAGRAWQRPVIFAVLAACTLYAAFVALILAGHGFARLGPLPVSVRNLWRNAGILLVWTGVLLVISARARAFARRWVVSYSAFAALAIVAAFLLSLGPEIRSGGRLISATGPYQFLYSHVPGFDGLRVPARYGMLVVLFVSIAAGFGAAALERRSRWGATLAMLLGLAAVVEAVPAPIMINGTVAEGGYAPPPPRVYTGDRVPAVYRYLASQPRPGTVVVEFPLGEWAYELRYVFYSTSHWHPILNGYSGHFPLSYNMRATVLRHPLDQPDAAWDALAASGATHAVVHGRFYRTDEGERIGAWLAGRGARLAGEFDGDRVFVLR